MSDVSNSVKTLNQWSHAELMALPIRSWSAKSEYESLMVVSTRRKHDSGWAVMAIIGVRRGQPIEIAVCCCDDIEWKVAKPLTHYPMHGGRTFSVGQFRSDCCLRSGALHVWGRHLKFSVGPALSSTHIEVLEAA